MRMAGSHSVFLSGGLLIGLLLPVLLRHVINPGRLYNDTHSSQLLDHMMDTIPPSAASSAQDSDGVRLFFHYALLRGTVTRALKVAALVTPMLTVLNHSAELLSLDLGTRFWTQVALTFLVPYSVSTYSSAMGAIQEHRRMLGAQTQAPVE